MASNRWLPPGAGKPLSVTKLVGGYLYLLRCLEEQSSRKLVCNLLYTATTFRRDGAHLPYALPTDLHNT